MNITLDKIKQIAFERKVTVWTFDVCPSCDYPMKFRFNRNHPQVECDMGCTCSNETYRPIKYETSSWEQVLHFINNTTDVEKQRAIIKFWNL